MLRFRKTKIIKEKFFAAKWPIKVGDINVDNIVISTLVKTKTNPKYLIGYPDKAIRPLVYVKCYYKRYCYYHYQKCWLSFYYS